MLALVSPDSWNLPLFLHVLGAMTLVGAVAAVVLASSRATDSVLFRRVTFWTLATVVLPAWVLMRFAGQWIDSKEDLPDDPTWLGVGFIVGDIGLLILLITTIVAWMAMRKEGRRWAPKTVTVLSILYLIALLIAMWAMSAKPD
jgi:hypothetical protein